MVALAVGLFLMGGILQVLVSSKASYRLSEAQARVQESGRYATQMLVSGMRSARSPGCRSIALEEARDSLNVSACRLLDSAEGAGECDGVPVIGSASPLGYDSSDSGSADWLAGLPGNTTEGAQSTVKNQWLRGDVLVSWGTVGDGVYMSVPGSLTEGRTGTLDLLNSNPDLKGGRLALVTDCEGTDIFSITNPTKDGAKDLKAPTKLEHGESFDPDGEGEDKTGTQVNATDALSRYYNNPGSDTSAGASIRARVFPFEYNVFYVCCMDTRSGDIQGGRSVGKCDSEPLRYRPSLCRWSTTDGAQQYVSDVADMRVTYDGYLDAAAESVADEEFDSGSKKRFHDLGTDPDAAWVTDRNYWDRVDSARVQLLAGGADEVRSEATSPNRDASGADDPGYGLAPDRRYYQLFEVTIATRATSPWYVKR